MACAVSLRDVRVLRGSGSRQVLALSDVTLELPRGCITALVGPNGSGKSTLLETLAGLCKPTQGDVRWAPDLAGQIGWLPQRSALDLSFPISVLDMVMLGHWSRLGAFGRVLPQHADAAQAALRRVGLAGVQGRLIGELSAGQLQRLLFARLMLLERPVMLLDEPFAAVDAATSEALLSLLVDLAGQGRTVVYSSHDLLQVRRHAHHCVLLSRRPLGSGSPAQVLTPEAVSQAQGQHWGAELAAA